MPLDAPTSPTNNPLRRAGASVAAAAARRRRRFDGPKRRLRRSNTPPPAPQSPSLPTTPSSSASASASASTSPTPLKTQSTTPAARRRDHLRQTLLRFPEHDPSTVASLLHQFHGDNSRVIERLQQARLENPQPFRRECPLHQICPTKDADRESLCLPLTQPNTSTATKPFSNSPLGNDHSAGSTQSPPSLPPLALSATHRRRPSRRFSRENAAPLWAAAVRTSAVPSDANSSVASGGLSETGRVAGLKRPRNATLSTEASASQSWTASTSSAGIPISTGPPFQGAFFGGPEADDVRQQGYTHFTSKASGTSIVSSAQTQVMGNVDGWKGAGAQWEMVTRLMERILQLESGLLSFQRASASKRKELGRRIEVIELEMSALEQRHEALLHELEESQRRVIKTEQYLDLMRRDVVQAIRSRQSRVFVLMRSGVNNALYYVLAYLVPIFAFVARGIRDLIIGTRRRISTLEEEG